MPVSKDKGGGGWCLAFQGSILGVALWFFLLSLIQDATGEE